MTTITITGDVVERVISNAGEEMLVEFKAPANLIKSGDKIDVTGSAYINSGDVLKIVSATNVTDGVSIAGRIPVETRFFINYDKTKRQFTMYGDANSSDEIRIEARLLKE